MRRRVVPFVVALLVVAAPSTGAAAEASGSLVGRVTDTAGQVLAGICVDAVSPLGAASLASTETKPDGSYELRGLVAGTYDVTFSDCDPRPTFVTTTHEGVVLVEGGTATADGALANGAFLTGRVVDADLQPVASVCVAAVRPDAGQLSLELSGLTSRDGSYRVGPLAAGDVVALVSDCRPSPTLVGQFVGGGLDPATATRLHLLAGATSSAGDVRLARGATITGRVDDGTGVAHRGACLSAEPPGATGLAPSASTTSNPDGSFVLVGLPPGTYHVGVGSCPDTTAAGTDVTVTAGQGLAGLALTLPASHVARLAGADRVATAAAVATARPSTTVVLVGDAAPTDALAAAPLAASLAAPLLLTPRDALAPAVLAQLRAARVTDAVLLGGTAVLGPGVERALAAAGVAVTRVAGPDRFATAAVVAGRLDAQSAYVVADGDWPDAAAVGALAALEGRPILLTGRDELPGATAEVIGGMAAVDVVGGRGVVGDGVVDAIARSVPHVARVAGADRFETSARIARIGQAEGLPYASAWVTSGRSWSDGLVAAVDAARGGGPLLLLGPATRALLEDHADELTSLTVVGGASQVSAVDLAALAALPAPSCADTDRC